MKNSFWFYVFVVVMLMLAHLHICLATTRIDGLRVRVKVGEVQIDSLRNRVDELSLRLAEHALDRECHVFRSKLSKEVR